MIKRYEVDGYGGYMSECQDYGDYVRYEDHAAEVEALRADAERYRWLRANDSKIPEACFWLAGSMFDDAINAARTAKEQP